MKAEIEVSGGARFRSALQADVDRERQRTPFAINEVLGRIAAQQRILLVLGTHPRGTPTGSQPGTPPWKISGDLRDSVRVQRARRIGPDRWAGNVGPTIVYGRIQELGGWTGAGHRTYLPPRPSLKPAWRLVRPTIPRHMRDGWI